MAATDLKAAADAPPSLNTLAAACRLILLDRRPSGRKGSGRSRRGGLRGAALQALYLSALALPGMTALADDDASSDEDVGYQYSHYQESSRSIYTTIPSSTSNSGSNLQTGNNNITRIPNHYNPITADSEHGYGHFRLDERIRFGFNVYQDVWSGATPLATAPAAGGNNLYHSNLVSGASPNAQPGTLYMNAQHQLFYAAQTQSNTLTGQTMTRLAPATQLQQTLAYASPEMRNQGDFKLGYDWDNAALDAGAGVSIEHDYLSRFGNLGGRLDFNRKLTSVNWGFSYTSSQTHAQEMQYVSYTNYPASSQSSESFGAQGLTYLNGERQDYSLNLGLSQVLSKNALLTAGFGFTSSNGYQANPYKGVSDYNTTPSSLAGYWLINGGIVAERRPGERNQFTWNGSYLHYLEPLQATAKLNYNFFHDDWGVNAHTFELEWRQALGWGWTFTPRGRYYTQTAANFFTPYLINPSAKQLVSSYYSSDQRLAGFGALSAGATLGRDFARGLTFELGFEYYAHASGLTLDGQGSGSYMDFSYYVANANIRADLGKLAQVGSGALDGLFGDGGQDMAGMDMAGMAHMQHGHSAPAGVMFAHMLEQAGDYMLGYRYMRQSWGNAYQHGTQGIGVDGLSNQNLGCAASATNPNPAQQKACGMYATGMSMNMHMLNLMYAPTDWLNLMLMPQFVNMDMDMTMIGSGPMNMGGSGWMRDWQTNGGFGDTGGYALVKIWDGGGQHLFMSQGMTAPTGTINTMNQLNRGSQNLFSYDMQLGSGTWDYNPSLTYTGALEQAFWGAQLTGTVRMQQQNARGYRLGDILQGTAWGGYQWSDWLSTTVRGVYSQQGAIKDYNYQHNSQEMVGQQGNMGMPDGAPFNYGGSFVDAGFGVTLNIPKGRYAGNSLSFEWLQPIYTYYNGYQLERTGSLAATWGYMF
ncbi:MAG: DUF3570 domain-containing protein [Methylococcales bacterium]|nr:DUF3570 domain-containing protein [Methylococcales bacterium]